MKAKISYLHKPYDLRIEEVEIPELKENEVLIKVGACGICGSDIECYEGHSAEGRYDIAPYTPGHEWGGKVVGIGSKVKNFQPGDKVTGDCCMQCNICENCKSGKMPSACLNFRETGFRPDSPGGMGEYLIMEEQFVHKVPDDWSYNEAAWVETFSVGYFGVWGNGGYVDASDDVVIMGAGPIGLSALMVTKTSGAKVIVCDVLESRRERAQKYGADYVVDPSQEGWVEEIYRLTGGQGGSLVVEATGNDRSIASLFDIAGHSARVRLIGHSIGRKIPIEIGKTIWRTLNITGSGGTKDWMPRTIKFLNRIRDKYDIGALTTHFFPFEKVVEAIEFASHNKADALKVMLSFDE